MAVRRIQMTIAGDTQEKDVQQFTAFALQELAERYPLAAITVRAEPRESRAMPASAQADTWEEEEGAHADIALLWERYCMMSK